ncbi:MAG: radical SAM protein [Leptospiraceae bacterium]|nr:radical SAM protein [Leptospiraceae bacterium]MDW8307282.1 radical SAM protein [Leptospiraceae bacterium]
MASVTIPRACNFNSDEELYRWYEREFSDLPFEVVYKQDILRQGLAFHESAFYGEYKTKDYFIFTFDRVPLEKMPLEEHLKAPEEIRIYGGPHNLRPTVISVRINPYSPYVVRRHNEKHALFFQGDYVADVDFPPVPEYYRHAHEFTLTKPIGEIAPVIEWGYLIYLTVFRHCQYFGKDEECQYCDINHNWRQQKRVGRPYTGVKSTAEVLEALAAIDKYDHTAKAYTITGGSVIQKLQGKNEVDFYLQYPMAIEKKFPRRWLSKLVVQAWDEDDLRKAWEAGVQIYHPNYEVWDRRLFEKICPGKARYIGWDKWMERILKAAKIFGAQNVIPNFVAGVEMAKPYGFEDVDAAVESSAEGLEFFMSQGITPRFTTWLPEPYTPLGESESAPLEYYLKLLRRYRELHQKYRLPIPPGYGPAGAGKAVFSVSAFMDVL